MYCFFFVKKKKFSERQCPGVNNIDDVTYTHIHAYRQRERERERERDGEREKERERGREKETERGEREESERRVRGEREERERRERDLAPWIISLEGGEDLKEAAGLVARFKHLHVLRHRLHRLFRERV